MTQHTHGRASREINRTQECCGIPQHCDRASARRCACNLVSVVTAKVRGQACRVGATTTYLFLSHPVTKIQIFSVAPKSLTHFSFQGLVIMRIQLRDRYISGIWGFHDGENKDHLLGYDTVYSVRQVPIFRRMFFPSSEHKLNLRFSHRRA